MQHKTAKLREASLADYRGIAHLQARNGLSTRSFDEWSALWTENPAYAKAGGALPIGWALESASGDIVGFVGNLPLEYSFGGKDLRAATPHSWAVDSPYRAYSMAPLLRFVSQPELHLIVCATVNSAAEKVYRACQFQKVPAGAWDTSTYWITGYRGFAQSVLRSASIPAPEILAYPLSATLFLRDAVSRRYYRRGKCEDLELCPAFDSRFDRFWEELKSENPDVLLAVRNRESLQWHYRAALARGSAWVLAATHAGRLVSYAVFDRQDHSQIALKRIRIADFQALRGFEDTLRPALHWMLKRCRDEGLHMAESVGCWLDRIGVCEIWPSKHRKLQSWVFYYKAVQKDLQVQLRNPAAWAPSSFDGDASL